MFENGWWENPEVRIRGRDWEKKGRGIDIPFKCSCGQYWLYFYNGGRKVWLKFDQSFYKAPEKECPECSGEKCKQQKA